MAAADTAPKVWHIFECQNEDCESPGGHWVMHEGEDNMNLLCPTCLEPG